MWADGLGMLSGKERGELVMMMWKRCLNVTFWKL